MVVGTANPNGVHMELLERLNFLAMIDDHHSQSRPAVDLELSLADCGDGLHGTRLLADGPRRDFDQWLDARIAERDLQRLGPQRTGERHAVDVAARDVERLGPKTPAQEADFPLQQLIERAHHQLLPAASIRIIQALVFFLDPALEGLSGLGVLLIRINDMHQDPDAGPVRADPDRGLEFGKR